MGVKMQSVELATCKPPRTRKTKPVPFQITERDIRILQLTSQHRFLNSEHIRQLVGGSRKNVSNRLKLLFDHGLLDRPECQNLLFRPGGGSNYLAYAITGKGSKLLANSHDKPFTITTNKSIGFPYLKHTLAIADFNIALDLAARSDPRIDLLDSDRLTAKLPVQTKQKAKPFRLNTPVVHQGARSHIGVEPDIMFSLHLKTQNRQAFFLVEIDRGTMPVERSNLRQTSILRKLLAYQTIWQSKLHQKQLGWHSFRVLFVTTSRERAENMVIATDKHTPAKGSPIFMFTDKQSLYSHDNLLAHEWLDCHGNRQRLLPPDIHR